MRAKQVKPLRRAFRFANRNPKQPTSYTFRQLKRAYLRLKDYQPTLLWAKANA